MTMQFRLMTYNIHKGIGNDRKYSLERIEEVVQGYNPDLVLLQEVDDGVPRSRHDRQVDRLASDLGYPHQAYQQNVHLKTGHYGNAVLSRFPLSQIENIDLTVPLKKRRQALVVGCQQHFEGHVRSFLVANLHLGLAGFERKIQLRRLLRSNRMVHDHRLPMILGGDFNDIWGTLKKNILQPEGFQSAGISIRTFPATLPIRSLDQIFYTGKLEAYHTFAAHTKLARQASDHLPLVADFKWTA